MFFLFQDEAFDGFSYFILATFITKNIIILLGGLG